MRHVEAAARKIVAGTLAACALLINGCGGAAAPTESSPRAVQATQLAAGALSAQDAAEVLLDVAEVRYYSYFLGHSATQTAGPFAYRYYPATQTYLGVVVAADPQYALNGVYVMGGAFGSAPLYVGPMTAFVNPVDLTSSDTDNGCYDNASTFPAGTDIVVARSYSAGPYVGGWTEEHAYKGPVNYQGHATDEMDITVTGGLTSGVPYTATTTTAIYGNFTGDGEFTTYGSAFNETLFVPSTNTTRNFSGTTIFQPPFADRARRLGIGQTVVQQAFSYSDGAQVVSASRSITTYLGRETITVPAGTYETCKIETIAPAYTSDGNSVDGSIYTEWLIVGTGIMVQGTNVVPSSPDVQSTRRATSVTRNGQQF